MLHIDPSLIGSFVTWKHKEYDQERNGQLMGAFVSGQHYLNFIIREPTDSPTQQIVIICVTTYYSVHINT